MFSVLFEVQPRPEQWDAYLNYAKRLKPELEMIDGFVDNIRYRSLTRDGWLLSLSGWRDEKALVRWRTQALHHQIQERGRGEVFNDYHLRVGQLTRDTRLPDGYSLQEQRLDETAQGGATAIVLVDARRDPDWTAGTPAADIARSLGLRDAAAGLVAWEVFDAVLTAGDVIMMTSWRSNEDAATAIADSNPPNDARLRQVRVIRDYGMFERAEAPQYYPDAMRR
jgi:heme-degrading monooxygenase HmoA